MLHCRQSLGLECGLAACIASNFHHKYCCSEWVWALVKRSSDVKVEKGRRLSPTIMRTSTGKRNWRSGRSNSSHKRPTQSVAWVKCTSPSWEWWERTAQVWWSELCLNGNKSLVHRGLPINRWAAEGMNAAEATWQQLAQRKCVMEVDRYILRNLMNS